MLDEPSILWFILISISIVFTLPFSSDARLNVNAEPTVISSMASRLLLNSLCTYPIKVSISISLLLLSIFIDKSTVLSKLSVDTSITSRTQLFRKIICTSDISFVIGTCISSLPYNT